MKNQSEKRICQNCKKDFPIEPDDFGFYEKVKVPLPTFCPDYRLQRRLAWRNERGLHNRECGLCGKKIISIYNKDFNNIVYCDKCWWSDKWDASDYAEDIDFSKPFLTQLFEFFKKVPAPNLFAFGTTMINSPYCNMANDMKNCHLLHDGTFDENVSYGSGAFYCKDSQDITMVRKGELCYEIVTCINCYQTTFSQNCEDCVDVHFSFGLRGCNNCFGCVNLHGKKYHIFNEPYTKEEYEQKLKSFGLDSYKNITLQKDKAHEFWKKFPKRYYFGVQNLNVTGDYLERSKNAKSCFGATNLEDAKFCSFISNGPVKTTYDLTHYGDNVELVYECLQCGDGLSNCKFGWGNWTNTSIDDSILNEIIACEHNGVCKENCMTAFRILPEDLTFYRRMNLPLPRLCPNCRHYQRLKQRNPLKLWHRQCMCDKKHYHHQENCDIEFETTYSLDRPEVVYCEKCYQQEVY